MIVGLANLAAYPVPAAPPAWAWDSLGSMAFAHVCQGQHFNKSQLAFLAEYPFVQFDKTMNTESMPNASQEDRFVDAARQVKGVSPDAKVLLYLNGLLDFPAFTPLAAATAADPSLLIHNAAGEAAKIRGHGVFDMRQEKMRRVFIDDAARAMGSGVIDGVFVDRADWGEKCNGAKAGWDAETCSTLVPAQRTLLSEMGTALGAKAIVLAKDTSHAPMTDWQVANTVMTSDAFCSTYCNAPSCNKSTTTPAERWNNASRDDCVTSMETIANMSARGQISQSHAMGPTDDRPADAAKQREFTAGCFLIAAGNLSYFSYADWASGSWSIGGTRWWEEYDRQLGAPTSPPMTRAISAINAADTDFTFVRSFASGTTVRVDVAAHRATIAWAGRRQQSEPWSSA